MGKAVDFVSRPVYNEIGNLKIKRDKATPEENTDDKGSSSFNKKSMEL